MQPVLANYTASITELQNFPSKLIKESDGEAIAILNNNKVNAYLLPANLYEKLLEIVDDYNLSKEVEKRLNDNEKPIKVSIDEL